MILLYTKKPRFKDIRFDKDIRKSYLEGRLGGIPHICSLAN